MNESRQSPDAASDPAVEDVEVRGHIIDSLILPKVLDGITAAGGHFRIKDISVGQNRRDPSFARIEVSAASEAALEAILAQIADHGATPVHGADARLVPADMDGAFPESFYSTTNQRTEVRLGGHWHEVVDQEMDCGLVVAPDGVTCRCVPMTEVRRGWRITAAQSRGSPRLWAFRSTRRCS